MGQIPSYHFELEKFPLPQIMQIDYQKPQATDPRVPDQEWATWSTGATPATGRLYQTR